MSCQSFFILNVVQFLTYFSWRTLVDIFKIYSSAFRLCFCLLFYCFSLSDFTSLVSQYFVKVKLEERFHASVYVEINENCAMFQEVEH